MPKLPAQNPSKYPWVRVCRECYGTGYDPKVYGDPCGFCYGEGFTEPFTDPSGGAENDEEA
jgi:hypothetical protein